MSGLRKMERSKDVTWNCTIENIETVVNLRWLMDIIVVHSRSLVFRSMRLYRKSGFNEV